VFQPKPLSPIQRRIVALSSRGRCDKEIATETGMSVFTVNTHWRRIFAKLGVRSRIAAAVMVTAATLVQVTPKAVTRQPGEPRPKSDQ
jgi:DNA-binding NarL/FixJ family response regulator